MNLGGITLQSCTFATFIINHYDRKGLYRKESGFLHLRLQT